MDLLHFVLQFAPDATMAGHALWLIIALPLIGAFISGTMGKLIGRQNVHLVAVGAIAGSFLLSALVFLRLNDPYAMAATPFGNVPYSVGWDYGTWFSAGTFKVTLGLYADHLSGSMLMVITGIGLLIHIYSTGYMSHDAGYWRFFAYLNLFVAAMLTLVLADSLPLLFVGWEGVGMCSYLLIGFWYDDPMKAYAGRKAFITNRIGDFGFLVASFLMVLVVESVTKLPVSDAGAAQRRRREVVAHALRQRGAGQGPAVVRGHRGHGAVDARPAGEDHRHRAADRATSTARCSPSSCCASCWARRASRRRFPSTCGCRTRWPARRRSPPSSTRPPW